MTMLALTGLLLFLRYAWPCAEDRLRERKIDRIQFLKLEWIVEGKVKMEISFLQECFPNAVADLEKFAKQNYKETWSLETVTEFWRNHHGHSGECAVRRLVVFAIDGKIITVNPAEQEITSHKRMINFYGIPLKVGDSIIVHRRVVIEKIES
jgi:hypothetical protein